MATQEPNAQVPQVDFLAMRNILLLAAFATEARRVLTDINHVMNHLPEVEKKLSHLVEAPAQWSVYEDTIPEVLNNIAQQLGALAGHDQ